jgi:hypothetical protein
MRPVLLIIVGAYVAAALVTTAAEVAGIGRQCGCSDACWCKRPGLRLFRWVAPFSHRSVDPTDKAARG